MRASTRLPGIRRAVAIILVAAFVFALAAPMVASAATRTTIRLSSSYMSKAKTFTISGTVRPGRSGKIVKIAVKRPGSTKWSLIGMRTTGRLGKWTFRYRPRTTGKYYFRATYGARTTGRLLRIRAASVSSVLVKSTTSTRDSGLWDALVPQFAHKYPQVALSLSSVGTGDAVDHTVAGVGDIAITHDRAAEDRGLGTGVLFSRRDLMYNDFLVVGPKAGAKTISGSASTIVTDPAGVGTLNSAGNVVPGTNAVTAFQKIWTWGEANQTAAWFYSRGERSGTHAKEGVLWDLAGHGASIWKHDPPGKPAMTVPFHTWYTWAGSGAGAGMASTLGTTNTNRAYTLVDRGTWEFMKGAYTNLTPVAENAGDTNFRNQYGVLESWKSSNPDGAGLLADWLTSAEGQAAIAAYGRYTFGKSLFIPNAK